MGIVFDVIVKMKLSILQIPAKKIMTILLLLFIVANTDFMNFAGSDMYRRTDEVNPLIEYVRTNIKGDEYFYSYTRTNIIIRYKNGYETNQIGNASKDNIIYGQTSEDWWHGDIEQKSETEETRVLFPWDFSSDYNPITHVNEIDRVVNAKKVYLIFSNVNEQTITPGLNALRKKGTLTEVMRVHDTPLYYFTVNEVNAHGD
jgi:hypothetical protein